MNRIFVDGNTAEDKDIVEFCYYNSDNDIERVICEDSLRYLCHIKVYAQASVSVYTDDIPKLIKALEAAYKHAKGENIG